LRPANVFLLSIILALTVKAQQPLSFRLYSLSIESASPYSNVINDLVVSGDTLWAGTNKGLDMTTGNGSNWRHFTESDGIKENGVTAIAIRNGVAWVAQSASQQVIGESLPAGAGLHYSTDGGESWTFITQSREPLGATVDTLLYGENKIPALAITTEINNLTYDLALTSGTVWTANFAGMLRKSTDNGATWSRVILPPDELNSISPTDSLSFDLSPTSGNLGLTESFNHRVFSVFASSDLVIWVGTSGGINKSTDGGVSWRKFSHQNQSQPISGNFVVAINEQQWNNKQILWAATVNALDQDEQRGVSFSEDGGETWKTALLGEFAHNIAFKDSIVYIATDNGLFRSSDTGASWIRSGTMYDPMNLQRITSPIVYTLAVLGEAVWIGGVDGIAYSLDTPAQPFGSLWKVFRTAQPVGNTSTTYSYPSPFSPDDEAVRIHYSTQGKNVPVTIRIFNYAMQSVKTLIQQAQRSGAQEHDEIWNGRDDDNTRISNGVYFYTVEVEGLEPVWGKIYVVE